MVACDKPTTTLANKELPKNAPIDQLTIEYYANPKNIGDRYGTDECTVKSAQAIIKAGLPFPNIGKAEFTDKDGKGTGQYYETFDYWICGTRYVFPRELVVPGLYPKNSPRNYFKLAGTLPHFWPKGESAGVVDGMGSLVDVRITEHPKPDKYFYQAKEHPFTLQDSMNLIKNWYEKDKNTRMSPASADISRKIGTKSTITLGKREDLGMWEMLYGYTKNDVPEKANEAQAYKWKANYWPIDKSNYLTDKATGNMSGIGCDTRHDVNKDYDNMGWSCYSGFWLDANSDVSIGIYVPHIKEMPNIFHQVEDLFYQARELGKNSPSNSNQTQITKGK